ncbi:MAG: hypothetical protein Q8P50_11360 [Bacillota bacterium]|nr:hypothetical protein [Bacillota bacterium]
MFRRRTAGDKTAGEGEETARTNPPQVEEQGEKKEEIKFGWLDILAFTIATFEIILPMIVAFVGIILVIYLALKFLAR